jgi:hypothetical protein
VLRECKVAHQGLVITRPDHRRVSEEDLSALYARRWHGGSDLRNLKTTTGRDVAASPDATDERQAVASAAAL